MNQNHTQYIAAKANLAKKIVERSSLIQQRGDIDRARNGNYNSQFWDTDDQYDPVLYNKQCQEYADVGVQLTAMNTKVALVTEYLAAALGVLYVLSGSDIRKENITSANFVKDRLFSLLSDLDNLPGLDDGVESSDKFIAGVSLLAVYNRQAFKYSL